jgi:CHAD domain-containing protein
MKNSFKLNKKIFRKKFTKILDDFNEELYEYITTPNDGNIHDIRVSIRRLESAYRILPKDVREKQKIKDYVKKTKTLFKMNAIIRDYDIICNIIESKYADSALELIPYLKDARTQQLKSANEHALEISDLCTPKISKSSLKKAKLEKRYLRVLDEIILDIQKNIIISLEDEKKIDELHALRKNFKKLRYSLEIATNKEVTTNILSNLKSIQDILGEIHDKDIIIDYLQNKIQDSRYSDIVKIESVERNKKYHAFVAVMKKSKDISFEL